MVQKLNSHLHVMGLTSNDDQPLVLRPHGASHPRRSRSRFHNLNLASAHMSNLIDFAPALPDDASNQIIRDVNLLRLQLRSRVGHHVGRNVGVWWHGDVGS